MQSIDEVKDTAVRLLSGILSNPNYNFDGAKKAANIAVEHAQALIEKLAIAAKETVGVTAAAVEKAAGEVEKGSVVVKDAAAKVKADVSK